jgi:hypothetical protein
LSETFLGLIALAVLVMAGGQVVVVMMAVKATRGLNETLNRIERDLRPIVSNVQAIAADAQRAMAMATTQVERADRLLTDAARRVEDTMNVVQRSILAPARDGMAIFQGVKAALMALREFRSRSRRSSPNIGPVPRAVPDPGDEDHASFIG